jgi:hypothetical protein
VHSTPDLKLSEEAFPSGSAAVADAEEAAADVEVLDETEIAEADVFEVEDSAGELDEASETEEPAGDAAADEDTEQ